MKSRLFYTDNIRQVEHKQYGSDKHVGLDRFSRWQEGISGLKAAFDSDKFDSSWRFAVFGIVLLVGILILVGRLFTLQIVRGREYFTKSERNRVLVKMLTPDRGVIYDRNGVILARNAPAFSVGVVYSKLLEGDIEDTKKMLKDTLDISDEELEASLSYASARPNTETIIKKYITYDQQLVLKVKSFEYPGVFVVEDKARQYPLGKYFSAILGYTGEISPEELSEKDPQKYTLKSYTGKDGIEQQYENYLSGVLGQEVIEIEANGKAISKSVLKAPVAGQDITLTIDANVQEFIGQLLEKSIKEYDATGGSMIIMSPSTGEVLAMVSLPTYDNNVFVTKDADSVVKVLTDPRGLLLNRSIGGLYAPGSIVKMAIGAEALQEGLITADTKISGKPQVIRVGAWEFPDWTYSWGRAPYGLMTVSDAISVSSDTFFYKLGGGYPPQCGEGSVPCDVKGLGVNGVVKALQEFGFGFQTGIDLPGEASGLVPNPAWKLETRKEEWFLGNTYHLSIGQGDLLATPIQAINLSNTIATDSKTIRPHLIKDKAIVKREGYNKGVDKPVYLENLHAVREGMVKATSVGIVYPLRNVAVKVAAKTGTAEFGSLNAKGEYDTHAWVTGFAPVENPQVSFVVMLESGGKSSNAARVAAEFINWYFDSYLKEQ